MEEKTATKNHTLLYVLYIVLAVAVVAVPLVGLRASETREAALAEEAAMATPTPAPTPEPTPTPRPLAVASQSGHPALMRLEADGGFHPQQAVTRREMAESLAALLEGFDESAGMDWPDLSEEDEAYGAFSALASANLLTEKAGEEIRPEKDVKRVELATILFRLATHFQGEEKTRIQDLARDVRRGRLLEGENAPELQQTVTRAEAARILVTLSGRELDEGRLILADILPQDVGTDQWAWAYVTDAVTQGPIPQRGEGVWRVSGWLYAADAKGEMLRDTAYGVWKFGPDGRYTTGNDKLDQYLADALQESGAADLTGREALEAAYLYVKRNFEYMVTPRDQTPEEDGDTGWEYVRALRFFRYGGGTCYGYAATFGLMARCLGADAKIVAARINQYDWPHSMVVIPEDGVDWIYDPELEDTRPERHADLELFHIQNFWIYSYWYTPAW